MIDNSPTNQSMIFLKDLVRDYLEQTTYPIDGFDWSPENFVSTKPSIYHSLRLDADTSQSGERREKPEIGRNLANEENTQFRDTAANQELPLEINGEPLSGRHVYQSSLYSANPSLEPQSGKLRDRDTGRIMIDYPDIPTSLKRNWGTEDRFRPLNLHGFTGNAPTPQRFTGKNFQPEGIIYGDVDENDIHRINRKPFTLDRLNQVARTLVPWNKTLDVNNLKHHNLELAQDIMEAGIPPILLESNIDTKGKVHPMPVRLDNEFDLVESHDPFTQWDKNNLNRTDTQGLEEFKLSEPMDLAMRLLKEARPYALMSHEELHSKLKEKRNMFRMVSDDSSNEYAELMKEVMLREEEKVRFPIPKIKIKDDGTEDITYPYADSTGMTFDTDFQDIHTGEPMEIAMQLLKEDLFPHHNDLDYHLLSHDELAYLSTQQGTPPSIHDIKVNEEIARREEEFKETEANLNQYYKETGNHPESDFIDRDVPIRNLGRYSKDNDVQIMMPMSFTTEFEAGDDDWQAKNASEPMEIAMQLLKERVSPEAKQHKLEYDKKYESSPERVKYREELNRERRRRHIMGQGGPDMSHTKDHTIVPESPHTNRARHFKDKGTLL